MHWQQGGERKVEKGCFASLEPIPGVKGELVHFFYIFGFWGVWPAVPKRSDRFWQPAWPVLVIGQTGFGNWPDGFVPRVGTCLGGVCICARGALVCFRGLRFLLEHGFVLDVSSRCPCLRGSSDLALCLSRPSISCWSFFYSFLFFLFSLITKCVCVLSMHSSGGDWGPCVVRGPVDGRFLVWWVIDDVMWTDSWQVLQVQVAAWLVLVQVKNKRERSLPVRPPGVEKTSRLSSRDPVASGLKYGPHGGKNDKMKPRTVS
jgi:hypothetical protein